MFCCEGLFAMKEKKIRDNVHGYISVPEIYINKFVDTEVFQRLRGIEQTSMRCLYPCAHHDRFAHSLGTFHIGRRLIKALINNLVEQKSSCYSVFKKSEWDSIVITFELACLLHDCAHAPFSHTLEDYMDYPYDPSFGKDGLLADLLSKEIGTEDVTFSDPDSLIRCTNKHE